MAQWEKLGGILGLLAGTGALAPEEAEGAVSPHLAGSFIDAWNNGITDLALRAGTFEPDVYAKLKALYPHAQNNVFLSVHSGDSRLKKQGWLPDRVVENVTDLLNSNKTDFPANYMNTAAHGALLPMDMEAPFAPLVVNKNGNVLFKTVFNPTYSQMRRMGYGVEGGNPLIPHASKPLTNAVLAHNGYMSEGSSQLMPNISDVTPQPNVQSTLGDFFPTVKKNALLGALGTGAALAPKNAEGSEGAQDAAYKGIMGKFLDKQQEPGLERPVWDPIDIALAPIGVPSVGAKIAAMAAEPFISWGMDSIMKQFLGGK